MSPAGVLIRRMTGTGFAARAGYFRKAAGTRLAASRTSLVRREATSSGILRISPALVRAHLVRLGPTSS